jgi:hypothetical protein
MSRFTKLFLILTFLFLPSIVVHSQDDLCDWAYVFSWQPNLDVGKYHVGSVYDGTDSQTSLVGIGAERFLSNRWGITGGISLGIDNSSQTLPQGEQDFSSTELGIKVGLNYYFQGKDKTISPYVGPWISYSTYSETDTFTPTSGTENENSFSTSSIGIGVTGGVYWQPWDPDVDFGFYYNLGAMISPSSTLETSSGGQTTETEGPSRLRIGDCGGGINFRVSF